MEIRRKGRPRLQAVAAQLLLGIVGVALITFVCFLVGFGLTRTAFAYVILIALVSLLGSFSASVVLSILATACLNFFFAPPLFELRIDALDDVERLAAFLVLSLIVTAVITKLKRAQEELGDSKAKLEQAEQLAHVGWWERDLMTDRVRVSDEVVRILGQRPVGRWLNLIHPEDRSRAAEAAAAAIRPSGPRYDIEYRVMRSDGTVRVVHSRGDVTWDDSGRPLRQFGFLQDITELKHAEQQVRASEARFRTFVDHASDAFLLLDENWTVLDVNRRAGEALGYSREELIGKRKSELDVELDEASIQRLLQRMLVEEAINFETRHRRKDGTTFPVEVRVSQFEQAGKRFLCLARDVTERKHAEQELHENKVRLEEAQRLAHVGWWERDFVTGRVSLSDEVCRIFGVQPVELPKWHGRWLRLIHPDDRPRVEEAAAAALSPGAPRYDVEYRVVRPDGTERTVHSQGDVTWAQSGKPQRQFGVLQDITELRRAEQELRESEERFRTLVQFSFDVYWESDAQHRFTRQENAQELGVALEPGSETDRYRDFATLRGKTRWEVPYLEPDAEAWRKHRETLDAHLPFRDFEVARRTSDGGRRYVSVSGLPVFDKSGRFVGYRGVGRHITERKRAEEALRRSEAYLAEAQRLSHTGTLAFNATRAVYWSQESYRIWGLDAAKGLPHRDTVMQRIHPDDRERVNVETEQALRDKRDFTLEFRIVLPDGTVKHIEATGRPLFAENGELTEMVATHVDVTERKRAQAEHERLRALEADLAHLNRLSIMGELTASLAHEILHPIASARNNARAGMRFLDSTPPNMAEVRDALASIVKDADRGKDIVDRIRAHIKKAPPRSDRFDINEAVREVIEMARTPIDKGRVSVRTNLARGPTSVWGDRVQVQQVVLNLILNAIEAMGSVEERLRMLTLRTEQSGPEGILVAVEDAGPGVDPEHLQRVFEPFYTTKDSGLGMGLSISRSIIDAHGGRLWAEANEPRGTVFQFILPAERNHS